MNSVITDYPTIISPPFQIAATMLFRMRNRFVCGRRASLGSQTLLLCLDRGTMVHKSPITGGLANLFCRSFGSVSSLALSLLEVFVRSFEIQDSFAQTHSAQHDQRKSLISLCHGTTTVRGSLVLSSASCSGVKVAR